MKVLLILPLFFIFTSFCQSNDHLDYFATPTDTVFCTDLAYEASSFCYLSKLTYTDVHGKEVKLQFKNSKILEPNIVTLKMKNVILDKVPLKVNKPDSYARFMERIVDGEILVYFYESPSNSDPTSISMSKFFMKMPNGVYYNIVEYKDINEFVCPYLAKSKAFKREFKGECIDLSGEKEEFIKMIKLYNSLNQE